MRNTVPILRLMPSPFPSTGCPPSRTCFQPRVSWATRPYSPTPDLQFIRSFWRLEIPQPRHQPPSCAPVMEILIDRVNHLFAIANRSMGADQGGKLPSLLWRWKRFLWMFFVRFIPALQAFRCGEETKSSPWGYCTTHKGSGLAATVICYLDDSDGVLTRSWEMEILLPRHLTEPASRQ